MKISNEQIIQSARRQRQAINDRMNVEPWSHSRRSGRGLAAVIGIAASLVSFIAGYGLHSANTPQPDGLHIAQVIKIEHDTIMQIETIRDTVYQTRTVTKYMKPLMAQSAEPEDQTTNTPSEQLACSMLCDDIPYELLAKP